MKRINHLERILFAFFLFGFFFLPIGIFDIGRMIRAYDYQKYQKQYQSAYFIIDGLTYSKRTIRGSSSETKFEMEFEKKEFVEWEWSDGITSAEGFPDLVRTQVPIGALWARQIHDNKYDVISKSEKGALVFRPKSHGSSGLNIISMTWVLPLLFLIFRIYQAIKSMKNKTTVLFLLFMTKMLLINAQTSSSFQGDRVMLGNQSSMQNLVFSKYEPAYKAKMLYKSQSEAKNETPESLVSSIISASSQDWVDYNTLGGSEKSRKIDKEALKRATTADREKVYFELTSKMNFRANGSEMCIIKFFIHSDGLPKPFSGTYLFQKNGSRWYHTATPWATNLMIMMMSFDDSKLATLLKGKPIGEPLMDELMKKVFQDNTFNLEILYKEYDSWYANKDEKRKNYFLDKNTWGY
jgi:hypothetical protein